MPELPEVETVRRGLEPFLAGARIEAVRLNRPDLRFPFPSRLDEALMGQTIEHVGRRAKYLLLGLSSGTTLLSHLGMTGSYRFRDFSFKGPSRYFEPDQNEKHDHLELALSHPRHGAMTLVYNDARRFGFMDLFDDEAACAFLAGLGPEPLGNGFSAALLAERFRGRTTPVKAALLDQRIVAGLGNIYVSEALHRARVRPTTAVAQLVPARRGPGARLEALAESVRAVLVEAIEAGGSTLRDFRAADGALGYFQHRFAVYDREGEACPREGCGGTVLRIVQSGRSSFFCPRCQRG